MVALTRRQTFSAIPFAVAAVQKSICGKSTKTPLSLLGSKVPPRKFETRQEVIFAYTVDDFLDPQNGCTFYDRGVVLGHWFHDLKLVRPECELSWSKTEWVYIVGFFEMPREPYVVPFFCYVGESSLIAA